MQNLTIEDFSGRVGEAFELQLPDRAISVTLKRAQALPAAMREGGGFRLDWLGPNEPVLPQAIYTFRHGGDAFEMFIVPLAQERQGTRYEAIFV